MFEHNEKLNKTADAIMGVAKALKRGDVLKYADIERLSGCPKYTGPWLGIIHKLKKRFLLERGIALRPVINVGYRLCVHDDQLKLCAKDRQKRAVRQLNRGVREVAALVSSELSLHQQQLRAYTVQSLISERRAVKRGLRSQREEIQRTETLPRRAL